MQFKIGEKVRIKNISPYNSNRFNGKIGEVVSFHPGFGRFPEVHFPCIDIKRKLGISSFYFDYSNIILNKSVLYEYNI